MVDFSTNPFESPKYRVFGSEKRRLDEQTSNALKGLARSW